MNGLEKEGRNNKKNVSKDIVKCIVRKMQDKCLCFKATQI